MASITRAWQSARRLALALLAIALCATAAADFKTGEIRARLAGKMLELGGGFELSLSRKVEEALTKGIPLEVVLELRLYRERAVFWNDRLAAWSWRREIRYHALSGQYLVVRPDQKPPLQESFATLADALRYLGSVDDLKLSLDERLIAPGTYVVRSRASLDIEALPAPLRPRAYTSLSWHLDSGWETWIVAR